MQLATREFQLSVTEYFRLCLSRVFRQTWWIAALIAALAVFFVFRWGLCPATIGMIAAALVYPVFVTLCVWKSVTSPQNKVAYEKQRFEFDDQFVYTYLDDGSESKIRYNHVYKAERSQRYYWLHLSQCQCFCIPVRAFHTEDDMEVFDQLLRQKGLIA